MQIGIDGITFSHTQPGGYKTYTTNLVHHLSSLSTEHTFSLYLHQKLPATLPSTWNVEIAPTTMPLIGVAYREQVTLPRAVKNAQDTLLHSPCATGPIITGSFPRVVTLLDTIEFTTPLTFRPLRLWLMRQYSRVVQARMARIADRIITISNYSKHQISQRFDIDARKISVIHLAAAERFSPGSKSDAAALIKKQYGLTNYILALASASPRKNISSLLASYALLPSSLRSKFPLALICTHLAWRDQLSQRVEQLGVEDHVNFLHQVTDDELVHLYRAAALFVFPSLEEGFGLPPLEAMACGAPVVAANSSSLPEVLGQAALLAPPTDTYALAEAMRKVLEEPDYATDLIAKGLAQSQQFSWCKTARETLAVYESL